MGSVAGACSKLFGLFLVLLRCSGLYWAALVLTSCLTLYGVASVFQSFFLFVSAAFSSCKVNFWQFLSGFHVSCLSF